MNNKHGLAFLTQLPRCVSVVLLLLTICQPYFSHAANVNSVRLWRAPDNTRLVFDLSAPVEHKLVNLAGEDGHAHRIVITMPSSDFKTDPTKINIKNTPVAALKVNMNAAELELIIDLSTKVKAKSFLLPANNQYGDRLVLDLFDEDAIKETKIVKPAANGMRDIVIAVDPGHGGEDPGAKGPGGLIEKNVTLAIAKELVSLINDKPGYSAFLTRSGDYYVSLRGRTQIARKKGADLFVSIHADAFTNPDARGAGVFALSQRGATSETARWLAQSENEADLIGGVNLGDKDPMLQEVLLDLSMTATIATSLDMGDQVMAQMKKITKMHKGFVEQAGFVVLKNPDIPSLLIETGFITNPEEAKKLANPQFRSNMARGIFSGIDAHFRSKPPMDTALAAARGGKVKPQMDKVIDNSLSEPATPKKPAKPEEPTLEDQIALEDADKAAYSEQSNKQADDLEKMLIEKSAARKTEQQQSNANSKNAKLSEPVATKKASTSNLKTPAKRQEKSITYVVKKGDTLSGIASRNKISLVKLREFNQLDDNQVRIGQTIRIPVSSN